MRINAKTHLGGSYSDPCEMIVVQSRIVEMEESVQNKRDLTSENKQNPGLDWNRGMREFRMTPRCQLAG